MGLRRSSAIHRGGNQWSDNFRLRPFWCALSLVSCEPMLVMGQSTSPQMPTDWDLYMLRLVNRARTDPVGEDQRQGTSYGESPAPPLAYSTQLGRAAQNHTEWMSANRNHPLIASSFHHSETLDDGTSGEGVTIGWSADSFTDRIRYTGYSSNWETRIWTSAICRRYRSREMRTEICYSTNKTWYARFREGSI